MAVLKYLKKLPNKPSVFYIEHQTRKHGVKKDRQWVIRQTLGGQTRLSVLGWQSTGVKEGDATNKVEEFKNNFKWNKLNPDQPRKPLCMADELAIIEEDEENYPIFKVFAERFIKNHVKKHLASTTAKEYERQIRKHFIPAWGKRRIIDIQRKQVVKLIEKLSDTAPIQANRTLATIKKMFSYALEVGLVEINPTSGIKPPAKETPKQRVLNLEEITVLFNTLETLPDRDIGDILRLITLTAQRPGEVTEMRISQLKEDAKGLWLELEPDDVKNNEHTRIYVNDMAAQIIKSRIDELALTHYIFPARTKDDKPGSKPSSFLRKDTLVSKVRRIQPLLQEQDVTYFTAHDLRRSAATGLARLGHGAIVGDILNHKTQGVTRRVYDLYSRDSEIQRALTTWGKAVEQAIEGTAGTNIIEINRHG